MRLALLLALVSACHPEAPETPAAAPAAAAPSPAPAERLDLNLPGLDPDPAYQFPNDEGPPPVAYPLPDGRVFVHDGYRDRVAVLDPKTGVRTELGEVMLVAAPRLGWLIVPKSSGPLRIHDVDPRAAKLRLLWEAPVAKNPEELVLSELAGVDRGAPLFMLRRVRSQMGSVAPEAAVQLVRLRGPGQAEVRSLPLPAELQVPGADAVRGSTLLLVEAPPKRPGDDRQAWGEPFTAKVFALDLDGGQLRPLGEATGDWSNSTAVPHAYVAVRWSDHDGRVRDIWFGPECVNTVDVGTVKLSPCTLKKQ